MGAGPGQRPEGSSSSSSRQTPYPRCDCGHLALDHAADTYGNPIGWCYVCHCRAYNGSAAAAEGSGRGQQPM